MRAAWAIALAAYLGTGLAGQAPAPPAFEAASVKRNGGGTPFVRLITQPGGRFSATNVTARMLVNAAFSAPPVALAPFQIVGGPDWLDTDRFDVTAVGPPAAPGEPPATAAMVRRLLEERFKLTVRPEKRDMPIYELVLARRDGGPGPRLRPVTRDCETMFAAAQNGAAFPPPEQCGSRGGLGTLTGGAMTMPELAGQLTRIADRMVVDRTGLAGQFDVELSFTPAADQRPPGAPPGAPAPAVDPAGPSFFTALQEQLGLKLEPARGPVDVIVIEHIERPTED